MSNSNYVLKLIKSNDPDDIEKVLIRALCGFKIDGVWKNELIRNGQNWSKSAKLHPKGENNEK